MNTETIPTLESIEQIRAYFGTRKVITKISSNGLLRLKEEAISSRKEIDAQYQNEPEAAKRMHHNGALAARGSVINRIDQLLHSKNYKGTGLGVNR